MGNRDMALQSADTNISGHVLFFVTVDKSGNGEHMEPEKGMI